MKKIQFIILLTTCLFSVNLKANDQYTDKEIEQINDSIITEGNLLYQLEKIAWISSDIAQNKPYITANTKGYFVYQQGDTIKNIFHNKDNKCIYELSFVNDLDTPVKESVFERNLTEKEQKLLSAKENIIFNVIEGKYPVTNYQDYNLNMIILPFEDNYKLYFITGATKQDIIPFGNDYLFIGKENGEIIAWNKFHSVLVPIETKDKDGNDVVRTVHSHLKKEPFISATDICTFKLYAEYYKQKEFNVYSVALNKIFTYNLVKNKITMKDYSEK